MLFWRRTVYCSVLFSVIHSDPLLSHPPPALVPTWAFPYPYRDMAGAPFPIMLCLHLTHQTVAVPAARAPAQITTRQLIELFFSSQAGGHCKNIPTLEYGFLVQVRPQGDMSLLNKALTVCTVSFGSLFRSPKTMTIYLIRKKSVEQLYSDTIIHSLWLFMSTAYKNSSLSNF